MSSNLTNNKTQTWFERNPKKTIFFILSFLLIITLIIFEKFLEFKNGVRESSDIRHIRLREHPPLSNTKQFFGDMENGKKKFYVFRTDDNGFIEPSKLYDNADKNLVFLGGSTTECYRVDENKRFPYLVGRLLENKTNYKINSYNSGVMGNNIMHSIDILINKIIPIKPDMVVLMHNINDLSVLIHEQTYWNTNPYRSLIMKKDNMSIFYILRNLKNMLFPNTFELIKEKVNIGLLIGKVVNNVDEFEKSRKQQIKLNNEKIISDFRQALNLFINVCKTYGIKPVLMTQANRVTPKAQVIKFREDLENQGLDYKEYYEIYSQMNDEIRKVAINNNVILIDLDKNIPKSEEYIYDLVHYNTNGSTYVANVIAENLEKFIK